MTRKITLAVFCLWSLTLIPMDGPVTYLDFLTPDIIEEIAYILVETEGSNIVEDHLGQKYFKDEIVFCHLNLMPKVTREPHRFHTSYNNSECDIAQIRNLKNLAKVSNRVKPVIDGLLTGAKAPKFITHLIEIVGLKLVSRQPDRFLRQIFCAGTSDESVKLYVAANIRENPAREWLRDYLEFIKRDKPFVIKKQLREMWLQNGISRGLIGIRHVSTFDDGKPESYYERMDPGALIAHYPEPAKSLLKRFLEGSKPDDGGIALGIKKENKKSYCLLTF